MSRLQQRQSHLNPATPAYFISITTYNRPDSLLSLLHDIKDQSHVYIYDDASTEDYTKVKAYCKKRGWKYRRLSENHGKKGYHLIVSRILKDAKKVNARYNLFLQDDIRLGPQFFSEATSLWNSIRDPRKATLYLFLDDNWQMPRWTGIEPTQQGSVYHTGWCDCVAFLYDKKLLRVLDARIPPPPKKWFANPKHSSGVGRQMSRKLVSKGYGLYRVTKSLVYHESGPSLMNPLARQDDPLHTVGFNEIVTASLASIPSRVDQLRNTVDSLLPQVDRLNVYLNGYPHIPDFLKHPSIEVAMSQVHGDRGDAGKFFWCESVRGYHFTCDDDILYPPDYTSTLKKHIDKHERKAAVGVHGVVLAHEIIDYYKSRRLYHLHNALDQSTPVHILGTGVLAYHTDTICVHRADFPVPNMADVWFGVLAKNQQVPLVCLPRSERWVELQEVPETLYSNRSTAAIQTKTVQDNLPWPITPLGRVASFIVPTTDRPELLSKCLRSLHAQTAPPGWDIEIIVVGSTADIPDGITFVASEATTPGGKINEGAAKSKGDLILLADDDDIQSPSRLQKAVEAFESGWEWSSSGEVLFTDGSRVSHWKGPPEQVGTTLSVTRELFDRVGGWPEIKRGKDGLFAKRVKAVGDPPIADLYLRDTVCIQHKSNLWQSRPFPQPDSVLISGRFRVEGKRWEDIPEAAARILR